MNRVRLRRWGAVGAAATLVLLGLQVAAAAPSFAATGHTIGSGSVSVYSGPGSSNSATGSLPVGAAVSFHCFIAGQRVTGPYGTEDLWDALDSGGYVPDALIYTGSNSAVVPACPSAQFGTGTYPVAWTGGGGAQPMSGPSTGSTADGGPIADGTLVTVACETTGTTLTDSAGFTSNLWEELGSGGYIPNVYLDTQVNGSTPGVPACSAASSLPSSGGGEPGGNTGPGGSPSAGGPGSSGGGSSGSGSSGTPLLRPHASDPCVAAWGLGAETTHSSFLGSTTDFSRTASLYQVCEGFPFSNGQGYSTTMKCVAVAALIALGGNLEANERMDDLCEASDVVNALQSNNWLGVAGGYGCLQYSDIFAEGLGILAAGALSESGPVAVTLGVYAYRAINATLKVVCGAIFDGGAQTWGYNNETSHEQQVAFQVSNDGKCLQEDTVLGATFWWAVSC